MVKQFAKTTLTLMGIAVAAAMLSSVPAQAQFLVVDCSGQNPFGFPSTFPSITSALNSLQTFPPSSFPPSVGFGGVFIGVESGPCNENVLIFGASHLTLAGPGFFAGFGLPPVTLNGNLDIQTSDDVEVEGLNVTGSAGDGIDISSGRSVTLAFCTSNGNAQSGLFVGQGSDVAILVTGAFSNNGNHGIDVESNSLVATDGSVDISNNQGAGLFMSQANFQTFGNTHMANNGQLAIDIRGGGKAQMGSFIGPNVIENNPNGGVSLQENAEISFFSILPDGQNTIRNNGQFGIEAGFGSQVTLAGAQVTGHSGPGVDIYAHSQLNGEGQIPGFGATQIQDNGTAGGPLSAAIRVDGNSETLLRGVTISQNNGPAILALTNSSADFAGNTFNGNAGVITCDSSSWMVSDLATNARTPAAGVNCATAHTAGNRVVRAPAVPDISVWKKLLSVYQQRAKAIKQQ